VPCPRIQGASWAAFVPDRRLASAVTTARHGVAGTVLNCWRCLPDGARSRRRSRRSHPLVPRGCRGIGYSPRAAPSDARQSPTDSPRPIVWTQRCAMTRSPRAGLVVPCRWVDDLPHCLLVGDAAVREGIEPLGSYRIGLKVFVDPTQALAVERPMYGVGLGYLRHSRVAAWLVERSARAVGREAGVW
jgi:hypothetical protein